MKKKSFDERAWALARRIPLGKVTTYRIMAEKMGTRAWRAVGNAMNRNPYSPKVSCHRVVRSDSAVGGFAGGTKKKISILMKEGIRIKGSRIMDFKKVLFRF